MGNALRERVERGDVAVGVLDNTYSPTMVEFLGELGADFVWLDLEHAGPSPRDGERLEGLLRAAERGGTELLVRVPTAEPELVRKALDAGVRNLFASRVDTAAEARRLVESARFSYDGGPGERGLASPRAARWGLREEYTATEDRETMVGVTVESRAAVESVEEIVDVPELGFVFVGPLDLSVALGHPGEPTHPEVEAAAERVRTAALDAGVPVGGLGFGPDDAESKAERGYRILNLGSTTSAVRATVEGWLDRWVA
ncbi:MAG: HpcH/HpaI aldolase/citrate lyase family protein [Halobacteriaceae archaeon]